MLHGPRPFQHLRVSVSARYWLLCILLLVATGTVVALDTLELQIERVAGTGWIAEGVLVQWDLPHSMQAHAMVKQLRIASQPQPLRDVRIDCPDIEMTAAVIACSRARISASATPIGSQQIAGRLVYQRATGALDVDLQNIRLANGTVRVRAAMKDDDWSVRADLNRVAVDGLLQLAQAMALTLPELSAAGIVTGTLQARGRDTPNAIDADVKFTTLTASNAAGSVATDKLSLALKASVQRVSKGWQWHAAVSSASGQAYAEPVFLDFGVHALATTARGFYADSRVLTVDNFAIDHQQTLSAQGSAAIDFKAEQILRDLKLTVNSLTFPGAYEGYLQPLLLDTNFKSMTTSGSIGGSVIVVGGMPQRIDLKFSAVTIDDASRTFGLQQMSGEWHWLDEASAISADMERPSRLQVPDSHLSWTGGVLLNLELGPSDLKFSTRGRQFRLLEPMRMPLLDGAIELESFRVRNAGEPNVAFMVDANIRPISVQRLSKAFGWPEFGGRIGGAISKLRMRDGVITLGTTLTAQVFDGSVTISDLKLEQPFGKWPRFGATIGLNNLDLELVTSAFSFGRITGRLSGDIKGLQMFNWQPAAFDADLHTPTGDKSPHRISQRAVENIGSIGGGGAGITQALSSGFLRFFEDFNYDRLGISCRLENEICRMNGVAPAPNGGYYLVKGKGVPRIDVIGGAQRVDWPRLVQQLIAVTESSGPVVR